MVHRTRPLLPRQQLSSRERQGPTTGLLKPGPQQQQLTGNQSLSLRSSLSSLLQPGVQQRRQWSLWPAQNSGSPPCQKYLLGWSLCAAWVLVEGRLQQRACRVKQRLRPARLLRWAGVVQKKSLLRWAVTLWPPRPVTPAGHNRISDTHAAATLAATGHGMTWQVADISRDHREHQ